ncbi:MAG: hypothetical protein E7331_06385 [Clostridiales bacterium]|nr:hypothetical protein [Clostridiales bacterium]
MTRITTHHPRSGWQKDEIDLLFESVRNADEEGRSLREVFTDVGQRLQRKPNSIRNYYYARIREMPELSARQAPFRAFQPEEVHQLLRQVLIGRGSGESVRACVTRLADGDRSLMLRYQNKYRSILKNRPEMLLSIADELRQEGLPCPENVVEYRRYGVSSTPAQPVGGFDDLTHFPAFSQLMQDLRQLAFEVKNSATLSADLGEGELWHTRFMDARQEADRLRVEVDLLKMALEDEREGRKDILLCDHIPEA